MMPPRFKRIIVLMWCASVASLAASCAQKAATSNSGGVTSGDVQRPSRKIFAHINEEHYLTISGKTYRGVAGSPPYYIDVPQLNSILFVTGNESHGNVTVHVVNKETGRD